VSKLAKEKKPVRAHTFYYVDYEKKQIVLLKKKCPRCGRFMADHKVPVPRRSCGYCGYTEFLSKSEVAKAEK